MTDARLTPGLTKVITNAVYRKNAHGYWFRAHADSDLYRIMSFDVYFGEHECVQRVIGLVELVTVFLPESQ